MHSMDRAFLVVFKRLFMLYTHELVYEELYVSESTQKRMLRAYAAGTGVFCEAIRQPRVRRKRGS